MIIETSLEPILLDADLIGEGYELDTEFSTDERRVEVEVESPLSPILFDVEFSSTDYEVNSGSTTNSYDVDVDSVSGPRSVIQHGLPEGGSPGDLLTKKSNVDYDAMWVAPATSVEKDNTRPITAGAVYTEIGNINALLATI